MWEAYWPHRMSRAILGAVPRLFRVHFKKLDQGECSGCTLGAKVVGLLAGRSTKSDLGPILFIRSLDRSFFFPWLFNLSCHHEGGLAPSINRALSNRNFGDHSGPTQNTVTVDAVAAKPTTAECDASVDRHSRRRLLEPQNLIATKGISRRDSTWCTRISRDAGLSRKSRYMAHLCHSCRGIGGVQFCWLTRSTLEVASQGHLEDLIPRFPTARPDSMVLCGRTLHSAINSRTFQIGYLSSCSGHVTAAADRPDRRS